MTDEQVRTAIAVLKAYVDGALALDYAILEDLERAIDAAWPLVVGLEYDEE